MDRELSWRSWFWNLTLVIIMLVMAGIATSVAFDQKNIFSAILFGIIAVLSWVGVVRAWRIGVFVRPHGIVMRGFTHTTTIRWSDVEEITSDNLTSGLAGVAGATTPVVVWRKPGKKQQRTELNVVGGYGASPVRPTPAERTIAGLNAYLEKWRQKNPAT